MTATKAIFKNDFEFYREENFIIDGWRILKLSEIADFNLGRTPRRDNIEYWNEGYFPWVSISDMNDFGRIKYTKELISKKSLKEVFNGKFSKKGTLLMSFKLTIGRTSILEIDAVHNEAIISITPDERIIHKDYLFYYLPTIDFKEYFDKAIKGNTLNKSKIANLKIVVPPLSEQKAIVEVLSVIQEAKEKTDRVIEAAKQLKKSMMKHLFTYGVYKEGEEWKLGSPETVKLKETEIGEIPEDWEVVRLGEVCSVKQGKQLSSKESKINKELKPFLRTSNILWNRIDLSNLSYMYFQKEEFEKLKLEKGDILVCEGGDIGRTAVWHYEEKEIAYQNHIHRVRVNRNIIVSYFLSYFMEFAITIQKLFLYDANRTTIPNLSSSRLKQFPIPLPPLPVQQKIAEILQAIDEKIEKEEQKKRVLENLFKSMLHNLMSGKIRVKINRQREVP